MADRVHPLACRCGNVCGHVRLDALSNRVVCYCKDCRAFARFLGKTDDVLDGNGGTEVVQVPSSHVQLVHGHEHLAVLRLTERGLMRWYAKCCNTPIGNTSANPKLAFVGVIHTCLRNGDLDSFFGSTRARCNTRSAIGDNPPRDQGMFGAIARAIVILASGRIGGRYKRTPFFTSANTPIGEPMVLKVEQLARLMEADSSVTPS